MPPAEHLQAFWPVSVAWWSPGAVIIARGTGAVTVASAHTLHNLLGTSPEWFAPAPRVSSAQDGGFLGLEVRWIRSTCAFESRRYELTTHGTG